MNLAHHSDDHVFVEIKCDAQHGSVLSERILRHVQDQAIELGLVDEDGMVIL